MLRKNLFHSCSYSLDGMQDGCYENSTVLINKFDIRDQKALDEMEQIITAINYAEIELDLKFENVDFGYYKNIHKLMFDEIYDWVGKIRRVNMSKNGINFCEASSIEENGILCFEHLKAKNYLKDMEFEKFIEYLTELYCDLNILHPFREGNGRVQRLFLTLLIKNTGYEIDFSKIDADLLMISTIKSVSGDIFLLKDILKENITKL
jgi:cell filamentation protein